MNTSRFSVVILVAVTCAAFAGAEPELRNELRQDEYSLSRGHLAIKGFDPVSYHQASGPVKGKKAISVEYCGVTYHFASNENKEAFLAAPDKYEPEYGGWCAWAMLEGDRTKPNPESFRIVDGKLYLFYDGLFGDTLKSWKEKSKEVPEGVLIKQADRQWSSQVSNRK